MEYKRVRAHQREQKAFLFRCVSLSVPSRVSMFVPFACCTHCGRVKSFCRCLSSGICSCPGLWRGVAFAEMALCVFVWQFFYFLPTRATTCTIYFLSFVYRNESQQIHGVRYQWKRVCIFFPGIFAIFECGNVQ